LDITIDGVGGLLLLRVRFPILGHLPGDLVCQRDGVPVFLPLTTMVLISVVLTLILNAVGRLWR
jgi:hypothetical protein